MTISITDAQVRSFYGKYRGTVLDNLDPERRGRLTLLVSDVTGDAPTAWAEPCAPLAGSAIGPMGMFMVPPIGAGVWVEFEQGDASRPIWVGCRWDKTQEVPPLALLGDPTSPNICMQTLRQQTFLLSDAPPSPATGGIVLKSAGGAMLVVNDSGIYINNGKGAVIQLTGPTVDINLGALTVT